MTDNMKKFLEAVSKDEAMKSELQAAMDNAVAAFAAKHGFTFTADDLKGSRSRKLTEDELQAVAGGGSPLVRDTILDTTGQEKDHCGCSFGGFGII